MKQVKINRDIIRTMSSFLKSNAIFFLFINSIIIPKIRIINATYLFSGKKKLITELKKYIKTKLDNPIIVAE